MHMTRTTWIYSILYFEYRFQTQLHFQHINFSWDGHAIWVTQTTVNPAAVLCDTAKINLNRLRRRQTATWNNGQDKQKKCNLWPQTISTTLELFEQDSSRKHTKTNDKRAAKSNHIHLHLSSVTCMDACFMQGSVCSVIRNTKTTNEENKRNKLLGNKE